MSSKNPLTWLAKKALRRAGSSACYSLERLFDKIPVREEEDEDEPYPPDPPDDYSYYDAGEPTEDSEAYWQESYDDEDDELEDVSEDEPEEEPDDLPKASEDEPDWECHDAPPEVEQQPEEEHEEPEEESEPFASKLERKLTRKFDHAIDSLFWRGLKYFINSDSSFELDLRSKEEKEDALWEEHLERHKMYKEKRIRENETYKLERHNKHLFSYPTGEEKDDF